MKRAVVTGATGFIGSWLVDELISHGVSVTVIVRNESKLLSEHRDNNGIRIIQSEIRNLKPEMFNGEYDCFFHLAWGGVSPERKNDERLQLDNIPMSIAALKLSNKIGCRRFIATGTVAEYVFYNNIMDVNARQTPNDIYGATKAAVYYYLEVLSRQLNQPFIWAVLPSTYGERRCDNNILTYTIKSLLAGEKPSYGNLEQLWDFLYVGDVVCALRLIGEKGQAGKVYGIGSGHFEVLKNYIMRVRDIINPDGELGIGDIPTMNEKTFSSCVNIYDLVKDTGFAPRTDFDEGIVSTIEWMRNNEDGGVY